MGEGGHTKSTKKLPDAFRYSPPQLSKYKALEEQRSEPQHKAQQDHGGNDKKPKNPNNSEGKTEHKNVANGHVPPPPLPPPQTQHRKEETPPPPHLKHGSPPALHQPPPYNKKVTPPPPLDQHHRPTPPDQHQKPPHPDQHQKPPHPDQHQKPLPPDQHHRPTPPVQHRPPPPPDQHHRPPLPQEQLHRPSPPSDPHHRTPPEAPNGANQHNSNQQQYENAASPTKKVSPAKDIGQSPPKARLDQQPKANPSHPTAKSDRPKAYDDYELDRRRQQMDRQGWPARDTKDYLIGGIYGPQPKSKLPNDAQRPHVNGHEVVSVAKLPHQPQPPSHAANRAQVRKQRAAAAAKQPYRSRSYPREDRKRVHHVPHKGVTNQQRNDPRSRSVMELKGAQAPLPAPPPPPRSRNQSRGGHHVMDQDDDYLLDEDDEDYVNESSERNGTKYGPRRGTKSRAFDGPVPLAELTSNDAVVNKARVVMFYKNGDPFFPGVKVSLRPGRDFASFEALCNHLTPRTDLPIGVRYIFTMDGEKVRELEELEDGGQYVCSSRKKFVPLPYGTGQLGWKPHSKFKMEEDLKLFRPPSPGAAAAAVGNSSDGQPGSRGKKWIRIINNDDQSIQMRHLLNNRTTQPWDNMIQGMADTLRMPNGKKLFSYTGKLIQSYSQLRNELRDGDIFYLCSDNEPSAQPPNRLQGGGVGLVGGVGASGTVGVNPGRSRNRSNAKQNLSTNSTSSNSPTLTHVDPIRMKIKGQRREVYPPLSLRYQRDESPPDKNLELNWVYGYRGHDTRLNLSLLPTGELLYFVAAVAVLFDRAKNKQRHYTGHTEDIQCLAVHPTRELVATGQKEGKGRHSRAQVHIWDIDTLSTQMIIGLNDVENGVIALSFSYKNLGQHLLIVDDSPDHMLSVWNWKSKRLLSKSPIHRQRVVGGQFIPKDDTMSVTFGESHLTVWRRLKDGGLDRDDLLDDDAKHVTCVEFDEEEEQYLLTGDTDGNIILWSDSRTGVYQTLRVIQAHMRAVSAMMMLPDGTLLSSGGHEKDRYIKAWDSSHSFRAITFARLPESAGGVHSFCPTKLDSPDLGIFAGTAKNMVLEGSIHRRFKIVVQGHCRQLAALAIDPDEPAFVTAGFDRAISRWAMHKLVWKVQVQSECTALAIHPLGEVVCVGTVDGHIIVLTLHRGMHVATLPATKQVVTTLAYSPDGSTLAVALEEGGLILYGVSGRGYAYRRQKILRGMDQILHMDWAIDCKAIQSVTSDYNLIFWDIVAMEQEKIPSTLRDAKWHTMTCSLNYAVNGIWNNVNQMPDTVTTTCCASTSEKLLAVGDDEGYIRLFRYPCITPRADFHELKAQSSKVNCVRFLYDDSFVISIGGDDSVLMQWMVVHAK